MRTECGRGHDLTDPANVQTYTLRDGSVRRLCARCRSERGAQRRARAREANPPRPRRRATECKRGHDLTDPANVLTKKNGDRQCIVCHRAATRAWGARKRAENPRPRRERIDTDYCAVEGCGRPRVRSGPTCRSRYCGGHLSRLRRYGEVFEDVPIDRRNASLFAERERRKSDDGQQPSLASD